MFWGRERVGREASGSRGLIGRRSDWGVLRGVGLSKEFFVGVVTEPVVDGAAGRADDAAFTLGLAGEIAAAAQADFVGESDGEFVAGDDGDGEGHAEDGPGGNGGEGDEAERGKAKAEGEGQDAKASLVEEGHGVGS